MCGHATIAAFNALRDKKVIKKGAYSAETRVGILDMEVSKNDVYMEQLNPIYFQTVEEFEVLDCFYEEHFIDKDIPIRVVSTGMREIFVPVKNVDVMHKLHPKMKNII